MNNESATHKEIGSNSPENARLVNQLQLQSLFPIIDFLPHVIGFKSFDNSNGYRVEKIIGKTFKEMMNHIKPTEFLDLLIKAAEQQDVLYCSFGVMIKDRNKDNFIFGKKEADESPRVYQVDLENMYDAITNLDRIDLNEQLKIRQGNKNNPVDQRRTEIEIADICDSLIEIFIEHLRNRKRTEKEQLIYVKLNKMIGSVRMKSFSTLINFFQQLRLSFQ